MAPYLGDFRITKTVRFGWNSYAVAGESITRATNGTISVYKDGNTTQSTTGVTDTEDFDSLTGVHYCAIDTSADGTFYSAGSDFMVVLSAATIDGKTINAVLAHFSLENRSNLMPTTDGRKLDVSAGGEAGVDWANVGTPGSTVNLSATTVKTATDVETDTADIQSRIPAALGANGNIKADVRDFNGTAGTFSAGRAEVNTSHVAGTAWASVDLTATMKTSVNTEVLDVMNTDTFAEPGQEAPGATVSLVKKIGYLYKAFRNKITQTSTQFKLFADDATTVDQKATTSDDGTTFTRGEVGTGP